MRRIADMIDVADVLGVLGVLVLAAAAYQFDPRWPAVIIGISLILIAVAYARAPVEAPPVEVKPPPVEE